MTHTCSFDVDEADAALGDEASVVVWSAYQRWRATKRRLNDMPSQDTNNLSLTDYFFGSR